MSDFLDLVRKGDPQAGQLLHDLSLQQLAAVQGLLIAERNRRAPSTKTGPTRSLRRDSVEPNFGSKVK